ncbi:MAG: hypothetical protein ACREH3_06140, partial [Geminicoccales bacterium]
MLRTTHHDLGVSAQRRARPDRPQDRPDRPAEPVGRFARLLSGSGERRARLRTLILIRWIAIVGQAFT